VASKGEKKKTEENRKTYITTDTQQQKEGFMSGGKKERKGKRCGEEVCVTSETGKEMGGLYYGRETHGGQRMGEKRTRMGEEL